MTAFLEGAPHTAHGLRLYILSLCWGLGAKNIIVHTLLVNIFPFFLQVILLRAKYFPK
jgi:hypothetical protein